VLVLVQQPGHAVWKWYCQTHRRQKLLPSSAISSNKVLCFFHACIKVAVKQAGKKNPALLCISSTSVKCELECGPRQVEVESAGSTVKDQFAHTQAH
jgi:hypothetical protein